jgi:hypothetical protein
MQRVGYLFPHCGPSFDSWRERGVALIFVLAEWALAVIAWKVYVPRATDRTFGRAEREREEQIERDRVACCSRAGGRSRRVGEGSRLLSPARRTEEGWALVAVDSPVDFITPVGEMMVTVQVAFAQFERRLISERTRAALAAARARGTRLGRPRLLSDDVALHVAELHSRGLTHEQVVAHLNAEQTAAPTGGVWSRQAVWRAARRGAALLAH